MLRLVTRIRSAIIFLALTSQLTLHSLVFLVEDQQQNGHSSSAIKTDISRYVSDSSQKNDLVKSINAEESKQIRDEEDAVPGQRSHLRRDDGQQKQHVMNVDNPQDRNENQHHPLYWNLSCPAELTMFSGAHMGGEYLDRALEAEQLSVQALSGYFQDSYFHFNTTRTLSNENVNVSPRKLFFIGDSLLRQVFISFVCIHWDQVEDYTIPWFTRSRGVRAKHPNTLTEGPHSKFEEARVRFRNSGFEVFFHHGTGKVVKLGPEYQSHEEYSWMESCYRRKPFQTVVPKLLGGGRGARSNNRRSSPQDEITIGNVARETITLSNKDVVIFNGSVHGERLVNLQVIQDLMGCQAMVKYPPQHWPTMAYMMTGASHFPTESGAFEEELLDAEEDFACAPTSQFHGYQDDEMRILKETLPMIGQDILDKYEYSNGHLHVGGRDCLHWLQPGIPDLLAAKVVLYLKTIKDLML